MSNVRPDDFVDALLYVLGRTGWLGVWVDRGETGGPASLKVTGQFVDREGCANKGRLGCEGLKMGADCDQISSTGSNYQSSWSEGDSLHWVWGEICGGLGCIISSTLPPTGSRLTLKYLL